MLNNNPAFHYIAPPQELWTDASNLGWGGHTRSLQVSEKWTSEEALMNINLLEVRAVRFSIVRLSLSRCKVLLFIDNQAALFALNKLRCQIPKLTSQNKTPAASTSDLFPNHPTSANIFKSKHPSGCPELTAISPDGIVSA